MKLSSRFFPFFAFFTFFLSAKPALASDDREDREVRIVSVQGDVRLSRGDGKRPDLRKPWEQAFSGELVEQGFAVATGDGRAEIEFENGSTVYLAENSLLLFRDLSVHADPDSDLENGPVRYLAKNYLFLFRELISPGLRTVSRITLATGTATFALQPARNDSFSIETPTDTMHLTAPETLFARVDAFLDATAITPQGEKGEHVVGPGAGKLQIAKGQTLFIQGGEVIPPPDLVQSLPPGADRFISACLLQLAASSDALQAHGMSPRVLCEIMETNLLFSLPAQNSSPFLLESKGAAHPPTRPPQLASDWDSWVSARVKHKSVAMAAALDASGLSEPVPGLVDMYEHGNFFPCAPYGTCWEPAEDAAVQDPAPQSSVPSAQSPTPPQVNVGFQPQTVQWEEQWAGWCGSGGSRRVSRVAHTPEELQKLLRKKESAERANYRGTLYSMDCYQGNWIPHRGHFARVVTPQFQPKCPGLKCKPVHPPRPVWVRAGNKIGFVPRHPDDVKGKPPINLKNGIIVPVSKPGKPVERITWNPSEKIKVLDKAPREFQRESSLRAPAVSSPEVHAHLVQELARNNSLPAANHAAPKIAYDYKSQKFMMAGSSVSGARSMPVPVGGITSNGKLASFADGHSSRYAESFGHSTAAASYSGSIRNSGPSSSGSYSSGGGHSSGGYSSGSHSSGSYSSGFSSSGGGSSHSSGGGGGSVSSSSSSSPASSGSAGGGSHGRP